MEGRDACRAFSKELQRYTRLRLLGPHAEGLVAWLQAEGYPLLQIRRRLCVLVRLERRLRRRGVRELGDLSIAELLDLAPIDSQDDIYLSALVRSLACYLDMCGVLAEAVDLDMKRAALAKAGPLADIDPALAAWKKDASILDWLEAL